MNELVLFDEKEQKLFTTSRIVAQIFGKEHKIVLRDIDSLKCSKEFHGFNFVPKVEIKHLSIGCDRKLRYFNITKDGFSFLVMGYTGSKAAIFKEKFINQFNKMESLLKSDDYIIERALKIMSDRIKGLEEKIREQGKEIKQLEPKAEYCDEVLQSNTLISTTVIAKDLGMSAMALNELLNKHKIIYKVDGVWVLYSKYQSLGYTHTKTHKYTNAAGEIGTSLLTYWTESGRKFIMETVEKILTNE